MKNKSKYYIAILILTTLLASCKRPVSSESILPSLSTPTSEVNTTTEEEATSEEDITSESDVTSDITTSEEEIIDERGFIDDHFTRSYYYDPASYNIIESVPSTNPYIEINSVEEQNEFYANNYNRATSYEDAMYRTSKFLISGDLKDTPQYFDYDLNHLPNRKYRLINEYRINEGVYEFDELGNYKSYTINNLEGKIKKIYYGAGYVSLEDVAAYLFAFGEGPANYNANKGTSAQYEMISLWGKYGRVNDDYYSSDVTYYLYEPSLPHTDNGGPRKEEMYNYNELDFGYTQTPWGYGIESLEPYNNGSKINRGTVRFVYSASTYDQKRGAKYIPVEHRHVFLTFNHYNDFVEYLNYEGGWGVPFGWMSAGNDYVAGMSRSKYGPGYYDFIDPYPQTTYPIPEIKTLNEVQNLLNSR